MVAIKKKYSTNIQDTKHDEAVPRNYTRYVYCYIFTLMTYNVIVRI